MSEKAKLLFRIRELEYIVKKGQEDAKSAQRASAEKEQYCRTLIRYQDYKIRKQAVHIELQEAKIQDMTEKHAKHCEDMRRQMRFLGGIAFRRDGTPSVEERAAYQHLEHLGEASHRVGSEPVPGEGTRHGLPAPKNQTRSLDREGDHQLAPVAPLASPFPPPSPQPGPLNLSKHDIELLEQIGFNISLEDPAETPAREPQGTTHQPNDWSLSHEQCPEASVVPGGTLRSETAQPLPAGFEHDTEESTQGYNGSAQGTTHRCHRWGQRTEVHGGEGRTSGGLEKPGPQKRKDRLEIPRKEKLHTPPYQSKEGRGKEERRTIRERM